MALAKPPKNSYIGTKEATRLLDKDAATVIRWGRLGRIKIMHQNPGANGAVFYDRRSVEKLAEELAEEAMKAAEQMLKHREESA